MVGLRDCCWRWQAASYDQFFINGRTVRCVTQKGTTSMFVNWAAFETGNAIFSNRDFCFLQVPWPSQPNIPTLPPPLEINQQLSPET